MGERLRALRKRQNLSARFVSSELGLSPNMVGAYERGEREPTLIVLKKLACFYKTSTGYILGLSNWRY